MADSASATCILTIAGASAELFGLGLVGADIRSALRSAREVAPMEHTQPRPTRLRQDQARPIRAVGGSQATDVRLDRLEEQVWQLRSQVADAEWDIPRVAHQEAGGALVSALEHADRRDAALRSFLSQQLYGGISRSVWGTTLFATGVVASAVANLI